MKQYPVPQGVDMQDRILGPLSLLQFGILLFGGLIGYLLYLQVPEPFGFWIGAMVFALSLSFSFETVRRMVTAAIAFVTKPRSRVWHKDLANDDIITKAPTVPKKKEKEKPKKKGPKYSNVEELASVLDTRGQDKNK